MHKTARKAAEVLTTPAEVLSTPAAASSRRSSRGLHPRACTPRVLAADHRRLFASARAHTLALFPRIFPTLTPSCEIRALYTRHARCVCMSPPPPHKTKDMQSNPSKTPTAVSSAPSTGGKEHGSPQKSGARSGKRSRVDETDKENAKKSNFF